MSDRPTYYLTTAIFYPAPKPVLHSMFEAVGADVIARYQRLLGREVRPEVDRCQLVAHLVDLVAS